MSDATPVLDIENLSVAYAGSRGPLKAVRGIDMRVMPNEIVGIVGESGCGKSTLIAAIMQLLAGNARITSGHIRFDGRELVGLPEEELRALRGGGLAMVAQNPMTTFNPVLKIGRQLEDIQYRLPIGRDHKRARAIEMFRKVGIADPERRLDFYPTQFSGGMLQRMSIAAALLTKPRLLVADEPTTALDVTLEVQILDLLRQLKTELDGAILFVSHHLGAVAELCDRVFVLYAGEVVESGPVEAILRAPAHPYTQRLLACDPGQIHDATRLLPTIPGRVPDLVNVPDGCVFAPRCHVVQDRCRTTHPAMTQIASRHAAACLRVAHDAA
jgi:oligopeptide/dipeptide ABC transporter ATP-binding protein